MSTIFTLKILVGLMRLDWWWWRLNMLGWYNNSGARFTLLLLLYKFCVLWWKPSHVYILDLWLRWWVLLTKVLRRRKWTTFFGALKIKSLLLGLFIISSRAYCTRWWTLTLASFFLWVHKGYTLITPGLITLLHECDASVVHAMLLLIFYELLSLGCKRLCLLCFYSRCWLKRIIVSLGQVCLTTSEGVLHFGQISWLVQVRRLQLLQLVWR